MSIILFCPSLHNDSVVDSVYYFSREKRGEDKCCLCLRSAVFCPQVKDSVSTLLSQICCILFYMYVTQIRLWVIGWGGDQARDEQIALKQVASLCNKCEVNYIVSGSSVALCLKGSYQCFVMWVFCYFSAAAFLLQLKKNCNLQFFKNIVQEIFFSNSVFRLILILL